MTALIVIAIILGWLVCGFLSAFIIYRFVEYVYKKSFAFKDLEDELDRANKLLQRVIEWSEWRGSGCPRFNDIKDDIKAFLEEAHHD